ncbi:MAG: HEPN domain-containing protein [Actinomycetota bacterium]|nr:HEPN domain-containing protein [Actinomycetota bacterium]
MTASPPSPDSDAPFPGDALLEQIFDLWVEPELELRGRPLAREEIVKALVVMTPGRAVRVLLNDEAELMGTVRATRSVSAGESVTTADFDQVKDIRPVDIDPDSGWVCFVRLGEEIYISFDFRQNRQQAARRLDRGEEFAAAARAALEAGRTAVAVDAAFAAAELAVIAQMLVFGPDERSKRRPPRPHDERSTWFKGWTTLGNAPSEQGVALADLARHRNAARYGKTVSVRPDHLRHLVETVGNMLRFARSQVS